ncbi:MAG: hypothetical protein RIB57_13595 [Pelagibacterium sp.]|uniref:phage tail assembly chaperone n=1 Tax=Pelagibacterium sp. TaxID=1967288 RepID=UPI0032EDC4E1
MRRAVYEARVLAAFRGALNKSNEPRPPAGSEFILNLFQALSATRSHTQGGPNPISYSEIEAYARLHRLPIEPRHVKMIVEMDRTWLEHAYASIGTGDAQTPNRRRPTLDAASFDAVFG